MLKAIVVDDEKKALERFARIIKEETRVQLVGKFMTSKDALEFIKNESLDIVFLDVEMPLINGIEFAEKVNKLNLTVDIIFVSAYEQYALNAFQVHAIGYLLKPIDIEDIRIQIDNVLRKREVNLIAQCTKYINKSCENCSIRNNSVSNPIIYVKCFGKFLCWSINNKQDIFRFRTAKTEELFAFLIHYQGQPISKEIIIENLWSDISPEKATNNFRVTCTYLRNAFLEKGIKDILIRDRDNYMVSIDKIQCDSWDFIDAINYDLSNEENIYFLEKASNLYVATYLENSIYDWGVKTRIWFEKEYEKLQNRLADLYIKKEDNKKAAEALRKVLEYNPLSEEVVYRLINIYFVMGHKVSGINIYNNYKESLFKEVGLMPSKEMKRLVENVEG